MTLFVGGPYDGRDLEFNPELGNRIRLPKLDEWDVDEDPNATMPRHCPFAYEYDAEADPPCFRFAGEEG